MNSRSNDEIIKQISFLEALLKASQDWRSVGEMIASSGTVAEAELRIAKAWEVSPEIASAVLDAQFRLISPEYTAKLSEQLQNLNELT